MPRCQLKITGRMCPDIGSFLCMAAVKGLGASRLRDPAHRPQNAEGFV